MFKILKTSILLTLFCVQCIDAFGQEISVKSHIRELSTDLTARMYEKTDAHGNACAVIKVELPSLPDISFSNSVGEVTQNAGEYVLYVSPGITSIDVMRGENLVCTIDMEGVEIEAKHTYQVVLALNREKVFRVVPENAGIVVNGEKIEMDSTGIGRMNCEVGVMYNYTITAPGYESINDNFMIAPDDAEVDHINKWLNRKTGSVKFDCNVKNIDVFADVEHIDKKKGGIYEIPVGRHDIRIISDDYNDWTGEVDISDSENIQTVKVNMIKADDVSKRLRTRYEIYLTGGIVSKTKYKDDDMLMESGTSVNYGAGFAPEFYFGRWIVFRPGLEFLIYNGDYFCDGDATPMTFSVPIVLSFNLPMGKYNNHHFSVGAGPVVGVGMTQLDDGSDATDCLVALRISAQLTLNHFVIGANMDYQKYTKNIFSPKSIVVGMLTIGYKY